MAEKHPFILPTVLISVVGCISVWFAGNAILEDLQALMALPPGRVGWVTSSVNLGFIVGTLVFAYWAVSDRFPARIVYFVCAILAASANCLLLFAGGFWGLILLRVFTGVMLAGIYPVGMKIAFSWYQKDIGKILGFLLGALTLGTALPHLLKSFGGQMDWRFEIITISLMTVAGGVLMLVGVPDGPHLPRKTSFAGSVLSQIFKPQGVRSAAFGYFGHMWELYSFWVFLPFYLAAYVGLNPKTSMDNHLWAFGIIASGCFGCVLGGFLSQKFGSAKVAFVQLVTSCVCCFLSPWVLMYCGNLQMYAAFLCVWGISVVGDSPQFSALVASNADKRLVGTSFTIINCIGFLISIISIELTNYLQLQVGVKYVFLFLAPGPILGMAGLSPLVFERAPAWLQRPGNR